MVAAGCSGETPSSGEEATDASPPAELDALTQHALGAYGELKLHLDFAGSSGRTLRAHVRNTSSEPARVSLAAAIRAPAGLSTVDLGVIELAPEATEVVTFDDEEVGFSSVLAEREVASLTVWASAKYDSGVEARDSIRVYIDDAFTVKTPEEVRELRRELAADPSRANEPFLRAGSFLVSDEEAERMRAATPFVPTEQLVPGPTLAPELRAQIDATLVADERSVVERAAAGVEQGLSQAGATVATRFCFFIDVNWSDNSVGDFLTTGAWTAQGHFVGRNLGQGWGADFIGPMNGLPDGCTPTYNLTVGSTVNFMVYSIAALPTNNGTSVNTVTGRSSTGSVMTEDTSVTVQNQATHNVVITSNTPAVNVAFAAGTALYMLRDGSTGHYHQIFTDQPGSGAACTGCTSGLGEIRMSTGWDTSKYAVVHELGHAIQAVNMPNFYTTPGVINYGVRGAAGLCGSTPTGTDPDYATFSSAEHMTIAWTEGFANFVGAAAFNRRTESDCAFATWTNGSDCQGSATWAERLHKTQCGGAAGQGVQWDWTRHFWDVYVASSFGTIGSFLRAADSSSYTLSNPYILLDNAANGHAINSAWDASKSDNGVNVCADGVQSGNVCCKASCGTCGGAGCSGRPGGASACCTSNILDANKTCTGTNAPCVLR
ncbi:hypothetical protein BE08_36760 [Sorangium cellulosum]|uniref:Uncharacterized protein n=1 Tax=Sorangium cellulosum TaxID=56 RepID=A0A150PLJ6_SORCE|nr:hypothetical protein BE08_36760 [Sorangium cellulosum]